MILSDTSVNTSLKDTLKSVILFVQIYRCYALLFANETKINTCKFDFLKTALQYFSVSVKEAFSKFFLREFSLPLTENGTLNCTRKIRNLNNIGNGDKLRKFEEKTRKYMNYLTKNILTECLFARSTASKLLAKLKRDPSMSCLSKLDLE